MKKIIKLFVSISTIFMVVFSPIVSACYVPPQPDLTITKTNNLGGGNAVVGTPFTWKIRVENTGNATATFHKNEMIVKDNMPSSHVGTYETVSVSASAGVTGVPSKLDCDQNGEDDADLVCRVKNTNGYSITIPAGDYIDFSVTVNPTSIGTITNPKPGSGNICDVDHEHKIDESNESNNACSDSVNIVAAPVCGDGIKNGQEQCDGTDGVPEHYTCTTQCTLEYVPFCGDQIVNDSETCEIGQTQPCEIDGYQGNQPCNQDCMGWGECILTESCGDGILNDSEQCDAGTQTCSQEGIWSECVQDSQAGTENCSNGLDDDCNGLIDCADDACKAEQSCAIPTETPAETPTEEQPAEESVPAPESTPETAPESTPAETPPTEPTPPPETPPEQQTPPAETIPPVTE